MILNFPIAIFRKLILKLTLLLLLVFQEPKIDKKWWKCNNYSQEKISL